MVALQFILEPCQAPILTTGSETGTKQGITFTFTAEKAHKSLVAGGIRYQTLLVQLLIQFVFECNLLSAYMVDILPPLILQNLYFLIYLECKKNPRKTDFQHLHYVIIPTC